MALEVELHNQLTAFDNVTVAELSPRTQIDAIYGARTKTDTEVFTDGSTGAVNNYTNGTGAREIQCVTGTAVGAYAICRTRRAIRYRPGQGMLARFSVRFEVPPKLGGARAGLIGAGTELSFGYDTNQRFGILYRTGGALEVRTLTMSVGAGGNETLTVTLNGTSTNVSLTSGNTAHAAFQIAATSFSGWFVTANGSTVVFSSTSVGVKSSTFSVSSTGTATGTFAQTVAGVAVTDTWTYMEDWNIRNAVRLDPTKGNLYQIQSQSSGYGLISFWVANGVSGKMVEVHRLEYGNTGSGPNLTLPVLKPSIAAFSLGSSTSFSIYGTSLSGFIEGQSSPIRNPVSRFFSKASVGTTATNLLSIRNRLEFGGQANTTEILPQFLTVAIDGAKPAEVQLVLNATLGGEPNWTYQDQNNSIVEYDTTGTTVTVGSNAQILYSSAVSKSGQIVVNLKDLNINLTRLDTLTIAVNASSTTVDVTASLVWIED